MKETHEFAGRCVMVHALVLFRLSASHTHVSALLHALVSVCTEDLKLASKPHTNETDTVEEEPNLQVISYLCQWKVPWK